MNARLTIGGGRPFVKYEPGLTLTVGNAFFKNTVLFPELDDTFFHLRKAGSRIYYFKHINLSTIKKPPFGGLFYLGFTFGILPVHEHIEVPPARMPGNNDDVRNNERYLFTGFGMVAIHQKQHLTGEFG
jgi:hypothetical protein